MSRFTCSLAIGLICLSVGCTAWNRIDVCDQPSPAPVTVNQGFEGIQQTGSPAAMVPLPGGDALVVFASEVRGGLLAKAIELRSVRLTADGARLPSCKLNDGRDEVLVPVDLTDPRKQMRESAFAVSPIRSRRAGLIVYGAQEGDRPPELWGLFFGPDGCPITDSKAFLIASVAAGEDLYGPSAVALPNGDFLVLWQELSAGGPLRARARLLTSILLSSAPGPLSIPFPLYRPTVASVEGAAVNLPDVTIPHQLYGMAPVLVGDEIAVAAHYGNSGADSQVQVWFFDDRLQMVRPPVQVSSDGVRGSLSLGRSVTAAYDGRTLLVGWLMNDPAGQATLFTRALDPEGRPRAPALRVGTQTGATDSFPVAMAWQDGHGFLVTWRQQAGPGDDSRPRILGRLLDSSGRPTFTARACGEEPFVIAHPSDGDRGEPSIAPLESNDVLAVWTDDSRTGADRSGSSIQGRVLALRTLFVGASRPVSGKAAPPAPDAGAVDTGSGQMCEATTPNGRKGGERCLCDVDCEVGRQNDSELPRALCVTELAEGFPGGMCHKSCSMSIPDSCGPGGVCLGLSNRGFCLRACTSHGDCGPGRACTGTPRACVPYCSQDSDCRSGHCDRYRGECHSEAAPLSGKEVSEACVRNDDCRSRLCALGRCLPTPCYAGKPNCAEGSVCVPFSEGDDDSGQCLRTCPDGTCFDPALTCDTQMGVAQKFCR